MEQNAAPTPTAPTETPAPAAAPKSEPLSPRFAALARKEAEAVKKLRDVSSREEKIKAESAAIAAERAQYQAFQKLWKENPIKAAESLGVGYNDMTKIMMNEGNVTPEFHINQLKSEIAELKQSLEAKEQRQQEELKTKGEQELSDITTAFQGEIKEFVKSNEQKFPLTCLYDRDDMIYSTIDAHYLKTGEIMAIPKAAELTEVFLQREAAKALPFIPGQAPKPQSGSRPELARKMFGEQGSQWSERAPKTLSNDISPSVTSKPTHFLSDEERIANAWKKLKSRG